MKNPLRLNKVPIVSLIDVLSQLFQDGADFIDIEGERTDNDENDIIKVTVRPEYYVDNNEEAKESADKELEYFFTEEEYKDVDSKDEETKPLSDEDINDLI